MKSKDRGLVAIIAISIAILLTFLEYYNVLNIPAIVLQFSWLLVLVTAILYFKKKFLWILGGFILLIGVLVFSLTFQSVQTYIAQKAAKYLSGELKTRVEIGSLYVKPFKSLVLEGLYVQDLEGDTLISTPRFTIDLNFLSFQLRKISVNTAQMDNGKFYIKQYKDSTTNVEFIVNYFNTGAPKPAKKTRKPYDITFDKITLNNIAFKYQNFNGDVSPRKTINFNDLALTNLNINILGLDTRNHLAKAGIRNLTFREKSGFYLKNLSSQATIDSNRMEFKDLHLETPNTSLSDYVLMSFKDFKDFGHFVSKVYVNARLKDSHLDPRDIAYFTPNIRPIDMKIGLNGDVSGYVNNIKARNLTIKAGQATYLSGNFDIKGLPKISETFLSLKLNQVSTNKQDADYIVKMFTGKEGLIPDVIKKFGWINFQGQFTGFPKDFIAHGEFKTALGRIVSDINMKLSGKVPVYTGTIRTYDFNIGELLDRKDLDRITMSTSIKGSSFLLSQLNESITSNITSFDYRGYKYSNIKLNGTFNDKLFNGKINVDDQNIKLDFDGTINIKDTIPEFNFIASIRSANPYALKLIKDTIKTGTDTLNIDADIKANFSGSNLDNIQGDFDLRKIRLTNPKDTLVIDSIQLFAKGIGNDRSLVINSDVFDASIKGQYDLKTLRPYFTSIVKKYIPSLSADDVTHGVQNFDLKLTLKYFEPVSLFFIPDLKIPDGAVINGKFVSSENIATLNGSAKLIQYKNIKITNTILDESNDEKALNVFITSDQINFSDSLYVKNINISNIVRNDSLALNIKLSDKDATNQLDLNGLVEFSRDTAISLSLLPSDVVINHETWKIQDKVRLKFDNGKTTIENFELFRDDQLLTINGILSTDPKDQIKADFKKFKLATFNSLTKPAGLTMKGELNGDATIASVMSKSRSIEAQIGIDSMTFNNTLIGNLKLNTDLDNATKLVNVKMSILKNDEETLKLTGTINANAEQNSLDMVMTMNNSDVIIFQPLLKNLVSNLQGTASAKMTVTGKLTKPRIDGELALNDVGMTVNYLKTPYRITDSVRIENSIIKLDNLIIRDSRNYEAIANGTVDMANPNIPDIHIEIIANNFMALNTTEKDNSLYYGTAYGTGEFNFNGPTNDMRIDIFANTEAGTVFNIPLNAAETIKDNDFIRFVSRDSTLNKRKQTSFKGLTMNFYLDIGETSTMNIFTDLGKLSGQGVAEGLHLRISSLGDFIMEGDYQISKGGFTYTAFNINRKFDISQGGSIRWTGDPAEAAINLKAVYAVRTGLTPLYNAAGVASTTDERVLSEAVMTLSNTLLKPDISFDLNFPANPAVKDELQSYLSNTDNRFLQSMSLIVRRTFTGASGDNKFQDQGLEIVGKASAEVIFNQLNNIFAQSLNLNFVDFNIRSFNDASATLRLLNGRLILSGGVTDKYTAKEISLLGSSEISRDVEAQYLIKRDGSMTLKASNKPNTGSFLNRGEDNYISALGLVYRQEFDNFNEFFHIMFGRKRREELQKKREEEADKATPPVALKPAPPDPQKSVSAIP